jgi:hypothetical protein
MPNFVSIHKLTEEQTWMLTAWVMSLRDPKVEKIPMAYLPPRRQPAAPPVEAAKPAPAAKTAPAKRKT